MTGLTTTNVKALAITPARHVFAGTNGGGVFVSTDNGATCAARNTGLTDYTVWALAYSVAGGSLYAGTQTGLFVSTDEGAHWSKATSGLPSGGAFAIAVAPTGDIFARVGSGGVYRSSDYGATWAASGDWDASKTPLAIAFASGGRVFAGTLDEGVFVSADGGATWTQSNTGLTARFVDALGMNTAGDVFAGTHMGVYRTKDEGETWENVLGEGANDVTAVAINSSGHVFAGTYGSYVWRSTSNGDASTWTQKSAGLSKWIWCLAVDKGDTLFAATYDGMYRSSDNGESWSLINNGISGGQVVALTIDGNGNLFCGTSAGIFRSVNNGNSWQPSLLNVCTIHALDAAPNNFVLAGFENCGIRMTKDQSYWDWTGSTGEYVRALAVNSKMKVFGGLDIAGVMMSTDTCRTFTDTQLLFTSVWCLGVASDGRLWAGTNAGVYKTTKSTLN
jgi:ligand-binding sensor domain-containing protein